MKIAINCRFLLEGKLEGIGRVTYELVSRLCQQHPEHTFILLFDRPIGNFDFLSLGHVKTRIAFPPARHPMLWYIWFEMALPSILKEEKADVFYSPDGYCSLKSKVPTMMVIHDLAYLHYPKEIPWTARKYYQHFVPQQIRRAEKIVCVSKATQEDLKNHFPFSAEKTRVIYNGTGSNFAPISKAEKNNIKKKYSQHRDYFLYLGAIHPRKNIDRLLIAFDLYKQMSGRDTVLLISGRAAWQTANTQAIYAQTVYKKDILFTGFIPEAELPLVLASARALVYVSLFEGFGLPILEAFASGVPVITSNISSMAEIAGDAALTVNPLSVRAIGEAMYELDSNKHLRKDLKEKGLIRAKDFDWENAAERTFKVLEEVGSI